MTAILRDSTVVVVAAVVRTRPRAIPLVMITMRKSIHGFPLVFYMGMGLRVAALRAAGAPLKSTRGQQRFFQNAQATEVAAISGKDNSTH